MNGNGGIILTSGVTAQALTTSPAKMTGFTANVAPAADDLSVVPAYASNKLTLEAGGTYLVSIYITGSAASATKVTAEARKNLVGGSPALVTGMKAAVDFATGAACNDIGITGIVTAAYGEVDTELCVYLTAGGSVNFTPENASIVAVRIDN